MSSSFVTARLVSPSHTQVVIGLSVLYFQQFLQTYLGPVLYGGLNLLTKVLLPFASSIPTQLPNDIINQDLARSADEVVRDKYKSSVEDRKSSKGSENDVYMLKTHGYNRYRFVSKSFISRNKLKNVQEGLEED